MIPALTKHLGSKPMYSDLFEVDFTSVIPAQAGIQALGLKIENEPGCRPEFIPSASKDPHDELSLRLETTDLNQPRERHYPQKVAARCRN